MRTFGVVCPHFNLVQADDFGVFADALIPAAVKLFEASTSAAASAGRQGWLTILRVGRIALAFELMQGLRPNDGKRRADYRSDFRGSREHEEYDDAICDQSASVLQDRLVFVLLHTARVNLVIGVHVQLDNAHKVQQTRSV